MTVIYHKDNVINDIDRDLLASNPLTFDPFNLKNGHSRRKMDDFCEFTLYYFLKNSADPNHFIF